MDSDSASLPAPPPDILPVWRSPHHLMLDLGGEGRYPAAWNVNISLVKTAGPGRGEPIPRLIVARHDRLPFATGSVGIIFMERTPLTHAALREIARVIAPGGLVLLRHSALPHKDPHAHVGRFFKGRISRTLQGSGSRMFHRTRIVVATN